MNTRAISVEMETEASVGDWSVVAAASAWKAAVMPPDVMPRHSSTVIERTSASARYGFTAPL